MTRVNMSVAPYYNDHDSSKQYTHLLAIPGRIAQAREITQIQSTVKDIVKSIGDSIMKDGDLVEGCQVSVASDKKSATVTAGRVYMNGMVLPVPESTIAISGTGTEVIGLKLMESLITELEDNTLRDPAQGYDNFNQPGCHRIKSWITVVKDDEDAAKLTTLYDGEISIEKYAPNYDTLTQTLARRTYDESGSYIVDGLTVRVERHPDDVSQFNVVVESGKAYVLGYELRISSARRLPVPRSLMYGSVPGVSINYSSAIPAYELSNAPYVKSITSVKGTRSRTINQTISNNTDRVLFDELEGIQILSVTQGSTTYQVGTSTSGDCYLQREGTRYYLKWNGTDNFPSAGSSYSVAYTYTYTFVNGKDYELIHNIVTDGHELSWKDGGDRPLDNTTFTVVYDQYLARKDIVYMDKDGSLFISQGIPAEHGFEVLPEVPVNTLALATIISPPGGQVTSNVNLKIDVSNIGLTRFTMNDIQKLLDRIRTMEYDQTVLSLNEEARQYETSSNKRGIFTDPIIDFSRVDLYYNLSEGILVDDSLPKYDATLDFDSNICYLPTTTNTYDNVLNRDISTAKLYSRTATLPKTGESVVLSQMNATKSFLINPYSMFPQLPEISITPAVDMWIEDTIITVPISQTNAQIVSASSRTVNTYQNGGTHRWHSVLSTSTSHQDTVIGTKVSTSTTESVISEKAITYIRRREIDVEGSQFPPNLNDIKCYFDGVETKLTPTGATGAGDAVGSVKADDSGAFTAKFTIPENILTGTREVRLQSPYRVEGYQNSAFALYTASGTARTIQRTVTTLTTVLINRVTTVTKVIESDPVGQTFVLDRMTLISGIDLYFENKPTGNVPVTCDIREVVDGTITSKLYGHCTLSASEVNVSSDGRVATRFNFDSPVLLEENTQYAFVVRSTSTNYRIWVAELGENDILTGETVLSNPYLIGVMQSSSNNISWTMHQTTDIKFRLIEDTYSNSGELIFNDLANVDEFSRIYLLAESAIPQGTSVEWFYSLDSGDNYSSISPYNIVVLDQMKENLIVKATLKKEPSSNLSPIVALDTVSAVLSCYDTEGCYITNNITGLDEYTDVDIIIDSYIPSNTELHVYVSTGGELIEATLDPNSIRNLNYGWREQTYKVTVPEATQCRAFIKLSSDYKCFTPSFRRLRMIMS